MRGVGILATYLVAACGQVAHTDAAPRRSPDAGRDSGAVPAEDPCADEYRDLVPVESALAPCEFFVPSVFVDPIRQMRVTLVKNGLPDPLAFIKRPDDCIYNQDRAYYFSSSAGLPTIVLCPAACASVSSGESELFADCSQGPIEMP